VVALRLVKIEEDVTNIHTSITNIGTAIISDRERLVEIEKRLKALEDAPAPVVSVDPITVEFLAGDGTAASAVKVSPGGTLKIPSQRTRVIQPDGQYTDITAPLGYPVGLQIGNVSVKGQKP
jgi:hypothetical protein